MPAGIGILAWYSPHETLSLLYGQLLLPPLLAGVVDLSYVVSKIRIAFFNNTNLALNIMHSSFSLEAEQLVRVCITLLGVSTLIPEPTQKFITVYNFTITTYMHTGKKFADPLNSL